MRIGILGTGGVARHAVQLLDGRDLRGVEIVGAATVDPSLIGGDLADVIGASTLSDVPIFGTLDELLAAEPDVIIDASRSFLSQIVDDVVSCVEAGVDFVSSCEELAYPMPERADDWERIDAAARRGGATVLGTGVNPGLIFDQLVLDCAGACWDVRSIWGRRVVDVSGFGEQIHQRLGIGYTAEAFDRGHETGTIAGHVGFPESVSMVVDGLGLQLDEPVTQTFEPYVAQTPAPTSYGEVPTGATEGFLHSAVGRVGGSDFIRFQLLLHLRPKASGFDPGDAIRIEGRHPVNLQIAPGMSALDATAAHVVNSIPIVVRAAPGVWSVSDLPRATAWLGGLEDASVSKVGR